MATNFLSRWSQRKLQQTDQAEEEQIEPSQEPVVEPVAEAHADITDAKQESEDDVVSVSSLLATGAETAVKKAALRKLFLSGEFSEVDALNDYDHDYKAVKSLSSDVAEKLREWVNDQSEQEPQVNEEDKSPELKAQPDDCIEENHLPDTAESEINVGQNIPHKE
ncbi:DUF3306 domain-containing protein [Vibrio sp. NTOU-M3]|uniref:DUF3306 domain-containing protein n=1 Tax=Vibrio sp. NTOU-M3 TaxID=3234954 RepID=UPI00349F62BB